jgi:hypothetical protein
MIPLEVGNLDAIVVFIVLIMFGPPLLLTIIGFSVRKNYPTAAKVLFILATVYLIAGLGICGSIIG